MRLLLIVLSSLASLACLLPAQTAGEIAGLLQRGKEVERAAQGLAACFPYEVAPHGDDILAAIAGLPSTAARRLPLAAFILAAPDSARLQDFLLERIGSKDSDERALAIGLAGFLPRPSDELRAAVVKALASADPASRLEAAIALGRPAFRDRLHPDALSSAEVMDALEAAFADRSEVVALAAARSWALGIPDQKRLEAQRKIVESGRGSRLVGAILSLAFNADEASLGSVAALMEDRRAGAAALWAFAHQVQKRGLDARTMRSLLGDPAQQKAEDRAELVLDLAALGVDCGEEIDFSTHDWDERTLEAFIRRGGEATKIGKVAPELAELEFTARFLNGEASPQLLAGKIARQPPFRAIWRAFSEARRRGGFDLSSLLPADPLLARLLRAGFLTLDDAELAIGDPKLAGKFDPALEIWGVAAPMLAGHSGIAPGAKFAALAEKLPALDRLLFAAASSFGTKGESSIVATRQVALLVMDDLLSRRDPALLERKLPRERSLRFRELADRLFLGLDSAPRRMAVTAALDRWPQAAPGLAAVLDDWDETRSVRRASSEAWREFHVSRPRAIVGGWKPDPEQVEGYLLELERIAKDEEGLDGDPQELRGKVSLLRRRNDEAADPAIASRLDALFGTSDSDYLRFLLLWAFPESAGGNEKAATLRRQLLDEGGGPEATALAAYQVARHGGDADLERIRSALQSEFRDLPLATLMGLLEREVVPVTLGDDLLEVALDQSPMLSVMAMDALARLNGLDQAALLGVVKTNLAGEVSIRRVAASRLLEQLTALSVAELFEIGEHLEAEDIGAARLALALGRLGRPDPRLRRRLELATCSRCPEKRIAARLTLDRLWPGEAPPLETLIEWRNRDSIATGTWLDLKLAARDSAEPSQIESVLTSGGAPRGASDGSVARLEIIEAAMRLLVARGEFRRSLVSPLDSHGVDEEIERLADRIAEEAKAKPSEEK